MTVTTRRRRHLAGAGVVALVVACSSNAAPPGGAAGSVTTVAITADADDQARPATSIASTIAMPTTVPPSSEPSSTTVVDPFTIAGWVEAENLLPGTPGWRIDADTTDPFGSNPDGWIEGYASATSALHGDTVTLFVDTPAASFTADVYRMGWYGGDRARRVASLGTHVGGRQTVPVLDAVTGMAEADWEPSLEFAVDDTWPPGAYLVRLDSSGGGAHYVPLTVRHPAPAAQLLLVNAVTTWQAYNPWGGCTLYDCYGNLPKQRADIVSFDRPYSAYYQHGAADFLTHELPLIAFIEELGIDVEYATSVDLHRTPELATRRAGLLSTGHDEYYSRTMRDALVAALDAGTNLAFFGANAIYRHIRLEPGADGAPERRMVNFRTGDAVSSVDPTQATVNWREQPLSAPEAEIVGIEYGCAEARADLRWVDTDSWLFAGSDAAPGDRVPRLVGVEFDVLAPRDRTPAGVEVMAASPVNCRDLRYQQVSVYRSTRAGGGVFAAGTIDWNCGLDGTCDGIDRHEVIRVVTGNVVRAFAAGPAGRTHPSTDTTAAYRTAPARPAGGGGAATTAPPPPPEPPPGDPPPTDAPPPPPPPAESTPVDPPAG